MQENKYYILEADGRSLTVENGAVTPYGEPTPIKDSPKEWRNIIISWERANARTGIQRSFTTPIDFVFDAAKIVRDRINRHSYEDRLFFLIQRLTPEVDDSFFRLSYKYLYKGELDLSSSEDGDTSISVNIAETGLAKKIKANESTQYEVPIEDDADLIKMDGVLIDGKQNYVLPSEIEIYTDSNINYNILSFVATTEESKSSGFAFFSSSHETIVDLDYIVPTGSSTPFLDYPNFFASASPINTGVVELTLSGRLILRMNRKRDPLNQPNINIEVVKIFGGERTNYYLYSTNIRTPYDQVFVNEGEVKEVDVNITIPVEPDAKLFILFRAGTPHSVQESYVYEFLEGSEIRASYKSKYRESQIKAYKPFTLLQKLMKLIAGEEYYAKSDMLNITAESDKLITSGDAVRGLEGAKIKISLKQLLEHINIAHFGGHGICKQGQSEVLEVEYIPYFYDSSDPIPLGDVKDPVITIPTEIIGNTFKIGWENPEVEDVNGKYSFNGTHTWKTNLETVVKELSFVSPFSADPYEIETARINYDGKTTTDGNSDNKVFVIHANLFEPEIIDEKTVYPLYRGTYVTLEGVPTDTIFNVELSPKRLIRKNGSWFRSIYYQFEAQNIEFVNFDRNSDLRTVQEGWSGNIDIKENAPQIIASLGEPIFIPRDIEFDVVIPIEIIQLLEENPNRCFSFNYLGQEWKGFNIKASIEINTLQEQRIKLRLAPGSNLLKLIR